MADNDTFTFVNGASTLVGQVGKSEDIVVHFLDTWPCIINTTGGSGPCLSHMAQAR